MDDKFFYYDKDKNGIYYAVNPWQDSDTKLWVDTAVQMVENPKVQILNDEARFKLTAIGVKELARVHMFLDRLVK